MGEKRSIDDAATDLISSVTGRYPTILADPPWRFKNRTGKVAPEYRKSSRYPTLSLRHIEDLPVQEVSEDNCHLYLWVPNALVPEGIKAMEAWGFSYKTNLVWIKTKGNGEVHRGGVGFYFRNATEMVLFGVKGSMRTEQAGRYQINLISAQRREHSRKPDELYDLIEACSPGPYLELFARQQRENWSIWGNELDVPVVKQVAQFDTEVVCDSLGSHSMVTSSVRLE